MTIRILLVSQLNSIFILIGAWQVVRNGDGFEAIYWKFLTGAVEENVEPRSGIHRLKIICQNFAYLRKKIGCLSSSMYIQAGTRVDLISIYVVLLV